MFEDKYGKQDVKLRSRSIKFKNDFKQFALEGVQSNDNDNNASYTKKSIISKLTFLLTKLHVLMMNLASHLFITEEKMQSINLLKQFLKK